MDLHALFEELAISLSFAGYVLLLAQMLRDMVPQLQIAIGVLAMVAFLKGRERL